MSRYSLSLAALICAAAVLPSQAVGGPILYAFSWCSSCSNATLETFDGSSPSTTLTSVGSMGVVADYGGLAYDSNNSTMYLVTGFNDDVSAGNSQIYSVNLTSGAATLIGDTGYQEVTGLTYDSANNTIYAAQYDTGQIFTIDTSTGAATALGSGIIGSPESVDNLAYDSGNGVLYGWADCLGCAELFSVDPSTGTGTLLSSTGLDSNDSGIVYDPTSNLLWDLDVRGYVTTIDPSTYAQTLVGTEGSELSGLALVPSATTTAPEPATILLTGAGAGLLMLLRRRAR